LPGVRPEWVVAPEPLPWRRYFNIFLKRRRQVLAITLIPTVIIALVSLQLTPVYRAYSRLQVEAEPPLAGALNELLPKSVADDASIQTQIQVLKSENLAWRTIEQLQLDRVLLTPQKLARIPVAARRTRLIESFQDALSVELVPRTRMLVIGYENSSPQLAAQIATTLAENYIDRAFGQRYEATRQASAWMEQQLAELKTKVGAAQQAVVEYDRRNRMVSTNQNQNLTEQMLSDLSRNWTQAVSARVEKEALYREVLADRSRMTVLVHNDLLQKLEERDADLQGQLTEALGQYGPQFPKVLRLQEQLADIRGQIAREQNRVVERIRHDYDAAQRREVLAAEAVRHQEERVGKLNQLLVEHNLLESELEGNRQLYRNLLQRLKEATLTAGLRSTNLQLIDRASTPLKPVRPRTALYIVIGFLASAFLGMAWAIAQEHLSEVLAWERLGRV
jgi:uncharacterized protein involved in exopolysaccharide biosynthesis